VAFSRRRLRGLGSSPSTLAGADHGRSVVRMLSPIFAMAISNVPRARIGGGGDVVCSRWPLPPPTRATSSTYAAFNSADMRAIVLRISAVSGPPGLDGADITTTTVSSVSSAPDDNDDDDIGNKTDTYTVNRQISRRTPMSAEPKPPIRVENDRLVIECGGCFAASVALSDETIAALEEALRQAYANRARVTAATTSPLDPFLVSRAETQRTYTKSAHGAPYTEQQ